VKNYKLIQESITGVDQSDGGLAIPVKVKSIADNKYFKFNYEDWDINWE
jgi:hypothetical protein